MDASQTGKNLERNQERTGSDARGGNHLFDRFWSAYPKKVGKGDAMRAWQKVKQQAQTLDLILAALDWQRSSDQWQRDGGQYVPNPATYIRQERWTDEPQKPMRTKASAERFNEPGYYGDGPTVQLL